MRLPNLKKPLVFIALLGVYFVVGKLSLKLAMVHPSASSVWPPSGLALAALVLLGYWVWPAIWLAAFLVNLTTAGSIATSLYIATGNALEALAGAYLLNRFAHGRRAFEKARDIFRFAALAGMLSTIVSASIGVLALCVTGFADWSNYQDIWLTWWLGDAVGVVVVAPALILWGNNYYLRDKRDRFFEATTLLASLVIVSEVVFNGVSILSIGHFPLGLLCIPLLLWAAFRFGPRETAVAILVMSAVAVRGALHGVGPWAQGTQQDTLLLVQAATGITSVMVLAVAANVSERKKLEEAASHLAAIVESSYDAIVAKDMEGRIVSWNLGAERMYGYTAQEAIGQSISMLVPPHLDDEMPKIEAILKRDEIMHHYETVRLRKDGTNVHVSLSISPVRDAQGKIVGASAIARDITAHKQAEIAMHDADQKLKAWVSRLEQQTCEIALLNQLIQLLQTCHSPGEVYAATRQFAELLFPGDSGAVCVLNSSMNLVETVTVWGKTRLVEQVFSSQECWALRRGLVHTTRDPNGPLLCQHLSQDSPIDSLCVPMVAQGETLGVLHLQRDQSPTGELEHVGASLLASREQLAVTVAGHIALALANLKLRDSLRNQSIRDPLTGMYNRRYLKESLEREVRRASRSQRSLAVIMLDVDHFKGFNDSLGHDAGDAILRELGTYLQSRTRQEDIPCRFGGDEFVIILADTSMEVAVRRAQQLQEGIKRLRVQYGKEYLNAPTISLGVAVFPDHGSTGEVLLRAADEALYSAKAQGRDRLIVGQATEMD
jgi:diguanylate cyclase (GGDEF)-like protein/PAS domain S-box-containing protein